MRILLTGAAAAAAFLAASAAPAQVNPPDVKWQPTPPGRPAGTQLAILSGHPAKAGPYPPIRRCITCAAVNSENLNGLTISAFSLGTMTLAMVPAWLPPPPSIMIEKRLTPGCHSPFGVSLNCHGLTVRE